LISDEQVVVSKRGNGKIGFIGQRGYPAHDVERPLNALDGMVAVKPVGLNNEWQQSFDRKRQLPVTLNHLVVKLTGKTFQRVWRKGIPVACQKMVVKNIHYHTGILTVSFPEQQSNLIGSPMIIGEIVDIAMQKNSLLHPVVIATLVSPFNKISDKISHPDINIIARKVQVGQKVHEIFYAR